MSLSMQALPDNVRTDEIAEWLDYSRAIHTYRRDIRHQITPPQISLARPLYWNWYRTRTREGFIRLLSDRLNLYIYIEEI